MSVSVVIPVKNGEPWVAEAIESVLAQGRPELEVIIVDGNSTDGSAETAASYDGVRVLKQKGTGLTGAWNQGIEAATGELIAFLDSDDRWLPGKLDSQLRLLDETPELDAAIGRARFFLEPGQEPGPGFRPGLLDRDYVARMPGTLIARRRVFERIGVFDESYKLAADVDWFARFQDAGLQMAVVQEVVTEKRVHAGNLSTSDLGLMHTEIIGVLRDSIRARGESE
jgi:glycosyltransferase involved in cell wall biosynthesis